jgi:hypothetical protein
MREEDEPMDPFSRDDLRALLANRQPPCISLFIPTSRGAAQEDKTHWKNQLRAAEESLIAQGHRPSEAKALLSRGRELLDDVPFWQNVSTGLAGFVSPQMSRFYRLPLRLAERVVSADHFHIKPLLPLLTEDGRFYILALSKKNVRLWTGTQHHVQEVELHDVPTNVAQALQYGDEIRSRTFHTHTAAGGRSDRREAIRHGKGPGADSAKDGLLEFFQKINRGLHRYLQNESAPLVLAVADYLLPIYQQANSYPHLLDQGIGPPDRLSAKELHDQGWAVVQPLLRAKQDKTAALYRQLAGTGRTAKDIAEIIPAASQGRVQFLFVARNLEIWGRLDPQNQEVVVHPQREPGDEDLLNLAALYTLAHKGTVYVVAAEEVPDQSPLAALFWLPGGQRSSQRALPSE